MGPDLSGLLDAVSTWAGVIVLAVLNVGAVLVVVSVALKGARLVLDAVRGGGSTQVKHERLSFKDWEHFEREEIAAHETQDYDRWLRAVERRRS